MPCKLCNDTGLVPINEAVSQVCPNGCNERLQAEYEQLFRQQHPEMNDWQLTAARLGLAATGESQITHRKNPMSRSEDDGVLSQT